MFTHVHVCAAHLGVIRIVSFLPYELSTSLKSHGNYRVKSKMSIGVSFSIRKTICVSFTIRVSFSIGKTIRPDSPPFVYDPTRKKPCDSNDMSNSHGKNRCNLIKKYASSLHINFDTD